jgi:NADP-dependent 3-hydroxy acid dehydrogenase YdfG
VDYTGAAVLKIAITGHTSGFGKYITQELEKEHEVIGFSKTNGYNLNTDVKNIIAECRDVDILINNACSRMCQII